MAFDYKKEYKEFYLPKDEPALIEVPRMDYVAVYGRGDPNEEGGEYKTAIGALYSVAFTLKMSKLGDHRIDGYFDYVVPPLEGLWWQEGGGGIDLARKSSLQWISLIRLPEFVTREELTWAISQARAKGKLGETGVEFFSYDEGMCVQCMHIGDYDSEGETVAGMEAYANAHGYETDITAERYHHEIYLSDARKVPPERRKTVIRHPIRRI